MTTTHPQSPPERRPATREAERAEQRATWPTLHPLSPDHTQRLAALRRVPLPAIQAVAATGLLKGATLDGHRCFIIGEANFAQARRLDGQPFTLDGRHVVKSLNLPGSEGGFIGASQLEATTRPVLLMPSPVALLEGAAALLRAGVTGWAMLAATSAGSRFSPAWLARLRGRRVHIAAYDDSPGRTARNIWAAALRAVGCVVDSDAL